MDQQPLLATGLQDAAKLRERGYTPEQIDEWTEQTRNKLVSEGWAQQQINAYFGQNEPDRGAVNAFARTMVERGKNSRTPDAETTDNIFEDFWSGVQGSSLGLAARGKLPDMKLPEHAAWYERLAASAGTVAGDFPAMVFGYVAGGAVGGAVGGMAGPGGAVLGQTTGALYGSGAVPALLRRRLVDTYTHGEADSWRDFWSQLGGAIYDMNRGGAENMAGGAAGAVASTALKSVASPVVRTAGTFAAEVGGFVAAGAAMDREFPTWDKVMDAALLIGGLKGAAYVAPKIWHTYSETGIKPEDLARDAAADPTIKQDLLKEGVDVPRAYETAEMVDRGTALGPDPAVAAPEQRAMAAPTSGDAPAGAGRVVPETPARGSRESGERLREDLAAGVRKEDAHPGWFDERPGGRVELPPAYKTEIGDFEARSKRELARVGVPDDHADATVAVWSSFLDATAMRFRISPDEALAILGWEGFTDVASISPRMRGRAAGLFSWKPEFDEVDPAKDRLTPGSRIGVDVSSSFPPAGVLAHETGHAFLEFLHYAWRKPNAPAGLKDDWKTVAAWAGVDPNARSIPAWSRPDFDPHEHVSQGFEHYVQTGKAPTPALQPAFDQYAAWMQAMVSRARVQPYQGVFSPEVVAAFDRLVSRQPEGAADIARQQAAQAQQASAPLTVETAREHVLSQIDRTGQTPRRGPKPWSFNELYRKYLDARDPVKTVVKRVLKELGKKEVDANADPYKLLRMLSSNAGRVSVLFHRGTYDIRTREYIGPALEAILKPIEGRLEEASAWFVARRVVELEGLNKQGREIDLSQWDMEAVRKLANDPNEFARFDPVFKALTQFQNETARMLLDAGIMPQTKYDAMVKAHSRFVPFYRVLGEDGETGGVYAGRSVFDPIKEIKGSEKQIADPLESVIKNTYAYVALAERNLAGQAFVNLVAQSKDALVYAEPAKVMPGAALTKTQIAVFDQGKRHVYEVGEDVAAAFHGVDAQTFGWLMTALSAPAQVLRAGIVLSPDFMARNVFHDMFSVMMQGTALFHPFRTVAAAREMTNKSDVYYNWLADGGGRATMTALDRRYLREETARLMNDESLPGRVWNTLTDPRDIVYAPYYVVREVLHKLRDVSDALENVNRLSEYMAVVGDRASDPAARAEGAYRSREVTVDFARMGANVKAMNHVTAFFNVAMQGIDRTAREIKAHPLRVLIRGLVGITLPQMLIWWFNKDDPVYQDIPQWERDLFFNWPVHRWRVSPDGTGRGKPDHLVRRRADGVVEVDEPVVLRIPKPREFGLIFGTTFERLAEAFIRDNPDAGAKFAESVSRVLVPSFMPTAGVPLLEQFANRSYFFDRNLVPEALRDQLPEMQYNPYTTEATKAISRLFGHVPFLSDAGNDASDSGLFASAARAVMSPILLDNYIRSWTGGLGNYALQILDKGLRAAGVVPDPVRPTPQLADIPIIRAFFSRYPSAGMQNIQQFFDKYSELDAIVKSFKQAEARGDIAKMEEFMERYGSRVFADLSDTRRFISDQNTAIRLLYDNPSIPPDEKRQLIDTAYFWMSWAAAEGLAQAKLFENAPIVANSAIR